MAKQEFGQLSHHWSESFDQVVGWLVSRKYDGRSVLWDGGYTRGMPAENVPWYYKGKTKQTTSTGLWTLGRDNKPKVQPAPDYFLDKLPKGIPVHGEIWYNDRLNLVGQIISFKQYSKPAWKLFKFIAFNSKPFGMWDDTCDLLPKKEVVVRLPICHPSK